MLPIGGSAVAKGLGWKRFDHISLAVPNANEAVDFYERLFGVERSHYFSSPTEGFRGAVLDMPNGQGQFEVLEPQGEDSFLTAFMERSGAGVHHITIEVEDVEAAVEYLREEMGIEAYRGIWSDYEWKQTFIHPKDTGGVLYQLFEWLPGHGPSASPSSSAGVEES